MIIEYDGLAYATERHIGNRTCSTCKADTPHESHGGSFYAQRCIYCHIKGMRANLRPAITPLWEFT